MSEKTFINPYNFEPIKDNVSRKNLSPGDGHHLFYNNGFTGLITCNLKALSYLFIPSSNKQDIDEKYLGKDYSGKDKKHRIFLHPFYIQKTGGDRVKQTGEGVKRNDEPYALPSSSIKGMLRSVAEALTNSCMSIIDEKKLKEHLSEGIEGKAVSSDRCRCYKEDGTEGEGLCICCRLFGAAIKDKSPGGNETDTRKKRNVFMGKLMISDAKRIKDMGIAPTKSIKPLLSPKMRHEAFYFNTGYEEVTHSETKNLKGRKFYYHHPDHINKPEMSYFDFKSQIASNSSITPFKPGTEFEFIIQAENLSEEELGLLLLSLELDEGMAHKMGRGKPLGLGSVKIEVTKIIKFDPVKRYESLEDKDGPEEMSGAREDITSHKDELKKKCPSPFSGVNNLKEMLTIASKKGKELHYPSKARPGESLKWFDLCKRVPLPLDGELEDIDQSTKKFINERVSLPPHGRLKDISDKQKGLDPGRNDPLPSDGRLKYAPSCFKDLKVGMNLNGLIIEKDGKGAKIRVDGLDRPGYLPFNNDPELRKAIKVDESLQVEVVSIGKDSFILKKLDKGVILCQKNIL